MDSYYGISETVPIFIELPQMVQVILSNPLWDVDKISYTLSVPYTSGKGVLSFVTLQN